MLINKPIQLIAVNNEEPPYDKNNKGIPVIGIIPITIPTLIKKWIINIPRIPDAIKEPY